MRLLIGGVAKLDTIVMTAAIMLAVLSDHSSTCEAKQNESLETLADELEARTPEGNPVLSLKECRSRVDQAAVVETPEHVMEFFSGDTARSGEARRLVLWLLSEQGSASKVALPFLLELLSKAVGQASKASNRFDDETAAICHAISRVADDEGRTTALGQVGTVANPTTLWCTAELSSSIVSRTEGTDKAVPAVQHAVKEKLLGLLGHAVHGEAKRTPTDKEPDPWEYVEMVSGLKNAGGVALSILREALIQTVRMGLPRPEKGQRGSPGGTFMNTERVSSQLCQAVVSIAEPEKALDILFEAVRASEAYALGEGCLSGLVALGCGEERAFPYLTAVLLSMDTYDAVKGMMAEQGEGCVPFLLQGLDKGPESQIAVLDVLVEMKTVPEKLRRVVRKLVKSKDKNVADKARKAMRGATQGKKKDASSRSPRRPHDGNPVLTRIDPCGGRK